MTREHVRRLLEQGLTITEIAETLVLAKSTVCYHVRKLGVQGDERFSARYDWKAIRAYYEQGFSASECRARFGFDRSTWHVAVARGDIVLRSKRDELLRDLSRGGRIPRGSLKRRLIQTGLKPNACERCGMSRWRNKPLSLALHHVNGQGDDNRLENLQILCPNCHSQTPNFSGRNVPLRRAEAAGRALRRAGAVPLASISARRLPVTGTAT